MVELAKLKLLHFSAVCKLQQLGYCALCSVQLAFITGHFVDQTRAGALWQAVQFV